MCLVSQKWGGVERYQFTWPDKSLARKNAQIETTNTLRPQIDKSIDFDNTKNLYLEGDNLEILKILRKTYQGKVNVIYIDPPYNTGSDLVYNDTFKIDLNEYSQQVGDTDSCGNNLAVNKDTNGRFHTDWLNMIYPRLLVAKDLLASDGIICISIDDNESANLKKICDEIFGEHNFCGDFIRKTKSTTNDAKTGVNYQHEFLFIYAKNKSKVNLLGGEKDLSRYANPDNDPNGPWISDNPSAKSGSIATGYFEVKNPYTNKVDLPPIGRFWLFSKNMLQKHIEEGRICFKKQHKDDERGFIYKRYLKDLKTTQKTLDSLEFTNNCYMNQNATKALKDLGLVEFFSYPKGVEFIKEILLHSTDKKSLVLDFFSGSATTAHAVMQLNAEDGGERQFILVQLPEVFDSASKAYESGFRTICDVGMQRIKKVGESIRQNYPDAKVDTGFRCLKLDSSNMEDVFYSPKDFVDNFLFKDLSEHVDNVKKDRTPNDLIIQIMLDLGIELSVPIETKIIDSKTVFSIDNNYLSVCLDDCITSKTIEKIAKTQPRFFVMKDSSVESDDVIDNFKQIFNIYSPETTCRII